MLRYMLTVLFVNLEIFSSQFTWWSQNTEDAGRQAGRWDLLEKSEICGLYTLVPQSWVSTNPHNVGYGLRGDCLVLLQTGVGGPQLLPERLVGQRQLVLTVLTEKCLEDLDEKSSLVLCRHLLLYLGMSEDLSLIIIQVGGDLERMNQNKKSAKETMIILHNISRLSVT